MFELGQYSDVAYLFLRLSVAAIFIYHAVLKLKDSEGMSRMMGMPAGMILMLGFVEVAGSLGLTFGVYLQIAALLAVVVMLGALYFKIIKWHVPFGAMDKTGWELDLILLAASVFLLVQGGGALTI